MGANEAVIGARPGLPGRPELPELPELTDEELDRISGGAGIFETIGSYTGWWSPQTGKAVDIGSTLIAGFIPGYGTAYNGVQAATDVTTTIMNPQATWSDVGAAVIGGAIGMIPGGVLARGMGISMAGAAGRWGEAALTAATTNPLGVTVSTAFNHAPTPGATPAPAPGEAQTTTFDDGSTMTTHPDGSVTSTPAPEYGSEDHTGAPTSGEPTTSEPSSPGPSGSTDTTAPGGSSGIEVSGEAGAGAGAEASGSVDASAEATSSDGSGSSSSDGSSGGDGSSSGGAGSSSDGSSTTTDSGSYGGYDSSYGGGDYGAGDYGGGDAGGSY